MCSDGPSFLPAKKLHKNWVLRLCLCLVFIIPQESASKLVAVFGERTFKKCYCCLADEKYEATVHLESVYFFLFREREEDFQVHGGPGGGVAGPEQ